MRWWDPTQLPTTHFSWCNLVKAGSRGGSNEKFVEKMLGGVAKPIICPREGGGEKEWKKKKILSLVDFHYSHNTNEQTRPKWRSRYVATKKLTNNLEPHIKGYSISVVRTLKLRIIDNGNVRKPWNFEWDRFNYKKWGKESQTPETTQSPGKQLPCSDAPADGWKGGLRSSNLFTFALKPS